MLLWFEEVLGEVGGGHWLEGSLYGKCISAF